MTENRTTLNLPLLLYLCQNQLIETCLHYSCVTISRSTYLQFFQCNFLFSRFILILQILSLILINQLIGSALFCFMFWNHICCVMVSMLASSVVNRGFKPQSGQTKDYKIGICCFSDKHAAFMRKSKYWLAQNHDNVSEWSDMSTYRFLFQ